MNAPCLLYLREYCGTKLQWHILQDPCDPQKAPDIVFDDVTFNPLVDPSVKQELTQIMGSWGTKEASSLPELLEQLVVLYMQHQKSKVAALDDERIQFELAMLDELGCTEVLLAAAADGFSQQSCFSIPVNVDLAPAQHLIDYLQPPSAAAAQQPSSSSSSSNTGNRSQQQQQQQQFTLHVAFRVGGGSSSSHTAPDLQLQAPQWFKDHLPVFSVPSWDPQASLLEYVPHLAERLDKHLQENCTAATLKYDLVTALAGMLGQPLEVHMRGGSSSNNSSNSSSSSAAWQGFGAGSNSGSVGGALGAAKARGSCSMVFQLAHDQQSLLLFIELGQGFPAAAPTLVLQVVRRTGPDSYVTLSNLPWSPRWPVDEMTARIFNYVKQEAPNIVREAVAGLGTAGAL